MQTELLRDLIEANYNDEKLPWAAMKAEAGERLSMRSQVQDNDKSLAPHLQNSAEMSHPLLVILTLSFSKPRLAACSDRPDSHEYLFFMVQVDMKDKWRNLCRTVR